MADTVLLYVRKDTRGYVERLDRAATELGVSRNALLCLIIRQWCEGYRGPEAELRRQIEELLER